MNLLDFGAEEKKMKKILLIAALLSIMQSVFCFDFNTDEFYVKIDIEEGIVVTKTELLHIREGLVKSEIVSRIKRPRSLYNSFGYIELQLPSVLVNVINLNGLLIVPQNFDIKADDMNSYGINEYTRISSSSHLIEKNKNTIIEYKVNYLLERLTREKEIGEYLYWSVLPWAVDIKSDKTPTINITLKNTISSFLLLNGYVDFSKQYLYFNNSRAKKIQVYDKTINKKIGEYDISDSTSYQQIILPSKIKEIEIKIIDTYPGLKYSDLCISSLVFNDYYNENPGDFGQNQLNALRKELNF